MVFGAGLIAGPPAGLLSHLIESNTLAGQGVAGFYLRDFFLYFLIVGPVEEGFKFLAVFLVALRRADFKTSSDGILLAIAGALGFAGGENVVYLYAYGLENTLPRLILGNLGHAAYGVYWGYALAVTLHEDAPFSLVIYGLILASLLHGVYNYLLSFSIGGAMLAFTLSGILFWIMINFLKGESARLK